MNSLLGADTAIWTRKAGQNRGQRRVWLEGARLVDAGWTRGTRFSRTVTDGTIFLHACSEQEFSELRARARGTVSGKGDKPVVDLNGQWLTKFLGTADRVRVAAGTVLGRMTIMITPERP